MIKTTILSALLLAGGLFAKAQTNQSVTTDTTHRHRLHQGFSGHGQRDGAQTRDQGWEAHRGGMNHRREGISPIRFTPEQRKQEMTINTDYRHKQADLYKQDNLTLGAYKTQLVALQRDKKAKLQALLTPAQQQQMANWRQRASENQQVMAAARLERLKIHLQLTDDQTAKIKSQADDFRSQMKVLRDNDNLLPDQKREQMMALFSKQKDAMVAVLTPDQQAKLKDMHGRFGEMHRFGK